MAWCLAISSSRSSSEPALSLFSTTPGTSARRDLLAVACRDGPTVSRPRHEKIWARRVLLLLPACWWVSSRKGLIVLPCKWLVNTESEYLALPCVFVRVVRPSVSGG